MKTKNEVIESMRSEIEMGNFISYVSCGQGGSGLNVTNCIDGLIAELESYNFEGLYNKSDDNEEYKFVENTNISNPHTYIVLVPKD